MRLTHINDQLVQLRKQIDKAKKAVENSKNILVTDDSSKAYALRDTQQLQLQQQRKQNKPHVLNHPNAPQAFLPEYWPSGVRYVHKNVYDDSIPSDVMKKICCPIISCVRIKRIPTTSSHHPSMWYSFQFFWFVTVVALVAVVDTAHVSLLRAQNTEDLLGKFGLFAAELIKSNTLIGEYTGIVRVNYDTSKRKKKIKRVIDKGYASVLYGVCCHGDI